MIILDNKEYDSLEEAKESFLSATDVRLHNLPLGVTQKKADDDVTKANKSLTNDAPDALGR